MSWLSRLTLQVLHEILRFAALSQDDRVGCHPESFLWHPDPFLWHPDPLSLSSRPAFLSSRPQWRDLLGVLPLSFYAAILHQILRFAALSQDDSFLHSTLSGLHRQTAELSRNETTN